MVCHTQSVKEEVEMGPQEGSQAEFRPGVAYRVHLAMWHVLRAFTDAVMNLLLSPSIL